MSIENEKKPDSFEEQTGVVDAGKETSKDKELEILNEEHRRSAERKLVRKLDLRLMPTITIIYLLNYIDRVAITAARLQGLEQDLGLTDGQYDTVVAILYASYCPAQIPSNMIIGYISRPSLYVGVCVVLWGLTSLCTGVTHSYAGIMACRVFIGLPEAAFYPGCCYLLSRWYTKEELAFRNAVFYTGLLISNAFGSLIAAGILANMQGALGLPAWRWVFYIEGAITIFIGFQVMWLLPDYPGNTRWLSNAEQRLAQVRLAEDAGEADLDSDNMSFLEGFKLAIKDPKVLIFMLMNCAQLVGLSYINFFPTLTQTLGYGTTDTLLLAAPPWIFATIACLVSARVADMKGDRFWCVAGWWWVVIIGYIIALSTMSVGGRYFSLFCMTVGYCGFALTLTWVSNAIPRPPAKRSVAMGLVNGFGNLGNLIGSFIWEAQWGPEYHPSMIIAISGLAFAFFLALVLRFMLRRENKKMDRDELAFIEGPGRDRIEQAAKLEGISFEEAVRRRKGFRYLI